MTLSQVEIEADENFAECTCLLWKVGVTFWTMGEGSTKKGHLNRLQNLIG